MNVLDLFSGIGGFSLGLERAGMRTVAFCEIDPYCRAVLAKHWPKIPIHGDIRTLTNETLADSAKLAQREQTDETNAQPISRQTWDESGDCRIDVICGGFPCQDVSVAGKGAGLAGARSGLWREYHRLIRELRPRYVIVENVAALLSRGLGEVLGDMAQIGYDAEWHCIPASYVGAPHRRDRIWIIAHPYSSKRETCGASCDGSRMADSDIQGLEVRFCRAGLQAQDRAVERQSGLYEWWSVEPHVGRVAHGVPSRVDRLRALGNAVVPQVVEIIGRAIMRAEA